MSQACPNKNSKEWNLLVEQVGEELAHMSFVANGYSIPDVVSVSEIKKAISFKEKVETFAGIAKRLRSYNAQNGTSHYFTKKLVYGNTWQLDLKLNYLPVNIEKQRQYLSSRNEIVKAPVDNTAFEELYPTIEYTPSKSEMQAGRFDEEGNFLPPLENEDFLLPDAQLQVKAVEKKRKEKIDKEIIQQRQLLKTIENPSDLRKVITRIESLKRKLEKSEQRVLLSDKIQAFETVLTFADNQIEEIEKILSSENISDEDMLYSQRVIDLWKSAGNFSTASNMHILLDDDEFNTPEIREAFRLRGAKVEDLESFLSSLKEANTVKFVQDYTSKNVTKEEILSPRKDISWIGGKTLNFGRSNDPMSKAIFSATERANMMAQTEADEMWKKLDKLGEKVRKKSANNYNVFKQYTEDGKETGRTVDRFSPEFYDTRNNLLQKAFHNRDKNTGEIKKDPALVKAYFDWINENTATFDARILFPDANLEDSSIPDSMLYSRVVFDEKDKQNHIAELKSHLGEKGYEYFIQRQEKKIEEFKIKREAIYESIQLDDSISPNEKEALFVEWSKEYSPYWNLDMLDNPVARKKGKDSFYAPKGMREYSIQVPKRKSKGVNTKWYDKNFEKIEQDEDLLEFHNYMRELMNTLKYTLPTKHQKLLKVGVIPTIQKSLIDTFSEKGMMMGIVPFLDKIKELQTTTDLSNIVTSDVNPLTGVIEKSINVQFIEDIDQKVRELVKIAAIKHEQKTGKPATHEEFMKFKQEARDTLSKQKSWDLVKIMKAYSLMVLAHKHKSFIEPQIKMAEQISNARKEIVTNKAGEPKYKDGKIVTQEGLTNLKAAQNFFLDSDFYSTGARKIEGVTKKKLYSKEETVKKKELEELIANEADESKKAFLEEQLKQLGGFRTGSGVGDTALKYMTLKGLGWNLPSAFSNIGFGTISNLIQASDGREYSMKNLKRAYMLVTNSIGRNLSFNSWEGVNQNALKIRNLMDKWNLLQTSNKELYDTSQKSSLNKLKRFGPYTLQERSEYLNQAPIMIATLMEFKALNKEGQEVELWEAYDHEGNIKEGYTSNVDEISMVQKIKRIIEMNHGDYNNSLQVKATFGGRALSQFRTWMFEGFANRFEAEDVDHALSYGMDEPYIRKGRYRSYTKGQLVATGAAVGTAFLPGIGTAIGAGAGYLGGKFFGMQTNENTWSDTLFTLKQLARKLAFQKTKFDERGFSKVDAANMRKNMTELYIMMSLMGVALLLKALADDDEEEENKFVVNFLLNQTTRLQTDISFYTNPLEFEKLTKTAVPMAQLVQDVGTLFSDVKSFFDEDDKNDIYESGPFKGDSKFGIHLGEMIPGTSQAIRLYKTGSKVF